MILVEFFLLLCYSKAHLKSEAFFMEKILPAILNCQQLQKILSAKIASMEKKSFISVAMYHKIKVLKEFYSQIDDLIELVHFYEMQNMSVSELSSLDFVREKIAHIEKEHEEMIAKIIGEYKLEINQVKAKYKPLEDNSEFVSAFKDFAYKKDAIKDDYKSLLVELNQYFILDKPLSYRILFDPKMISIIQKNLSSADQAIYDRALTLIRNKKEDMPFESLSLQLYNVLKKSPILLKYMGNQTDVYNLVGEDLLKTTGATDDLKTLIYSSRTDDRENLMDIINRVISGSEKDQKSALDRRQAKYEKENSRYRNELNRWKNESELRQRIIERKPNKIDAKKMHVSMLQMIRMYFGDEKLLACCDQTLRYLNGLVENFQLQKETQNYHVYIEMLDKILEDCRQNDTDLQEEQKRFRCNTKIVESSQKIKDDQNSISSINKDMKSIGLFRRIFSEKKFYQELKKKRKSIEEDIVDLTEEIKKNKEEINQCGFDPYSKDICGDNYRINNRLYQKQYAHLEVIKMVFQLAPLDKEWKLEMEKKYCQFFNLLVSSKFVDIIGLYSLLQELYSKLKKEESKVISKPRQSLSLNSIDVSFRNLLAQFIGRNLETLRNYSEDLFYVELLISFIKELKTGLYQNPIKPNFRHFNFILKDPTALQAYLSCDGVLQQGMKRQRLNETLS